MSVPNIKMAQWAATNKNRKMAEFIKFFQTYIRIQIEFHLVLLIKNSKFVGIQNNWTLNYHFGQK